MTPRILLAALALLVITAAPAHSRPLVDVAAIPAYQTDTGDSHASRSRARAHRSSASTSRGCLTSDTRSVLEAAEVHFGVTFALVSTCRPGARIAGTSHMSEHSRGRAVDLMVPRGTSKAAVVQYFLAHAKGVTMTYAHMSHVHFDTGGYHKLACGGCGAKRHARVGGGRHHMARLQ